MSLESLLNRGFRTSQSLSHNDQNILIHSNGVCIVSINELHPIVVQGKTVINVNFQTTQKTNRLNNTVVGKAKRGGQQLKVETPLCTVKCSDDSEYVVWSCIDGKLLEVNENLICNPSLLASQPITNGYVALILPSRAFSVEENIRTLPFTQTINTTVKDAGC